MGRICIACKPRGWAWMPHTLCPWGLPAGGQDQGRWPVRWRALARHPAPPVDEGGPHQGWERCRRGGGAAEAAAGACGAAATGGANDWPPTSGHVPGAVGGRPRPIGRGGCRGMHGWAAQEQSKGSGAAGARQAAAASACPVQPAAALRPGADRKSVQTCPTQTVHWRAAHHRYEGIVTKSTSQGHEQQQLGAGGQSRNRRGGAGQQPGGPLRSKL